MKTIPVSLVFASTLLGAWADPAPTEGPTPPAAGETHPAPPAGEPHRGGGGNKRASAEFWKRADTNGDGFVSKEEFFALPRIAKLPEEKRLKLFERLDKDGDGKLSKEELVKMGEGGPPLGFPRLAELDTDHSGGVSFEEFKAAEFVKKLPPDQQEALFKRLDRDGDGQITPKDRPAEQPHHENEGGENGPGMGLRQILRTLDANGDGAVTFEEFQKAPFAERMGEDALEKRFEKLDRNGDKKLTIDDAKPEGEGGEHMERPERPRPTDQPKPPGQ